jgi:hypothetical protein
VCVRSSTVPGQALSFQAPQSASHVLWEKFPSAPPVSRPKSRTFSPRPCGWGRSWFWTASGSSMASAPMRIAVRGRVVVPAGLFARPDHHRCGLLQVHDAPHAPWARRSADDLYPVQVLIKRATEQLVFGRRWPDRAKPVGTSNANRSSAAAYTYSSIAQIPSRPTTTQSATSGGQLSTARS